MKIIKKSKRITEAKPATGAPAQLPALNSANINALFSSAEFKKPVSEAEAESYLADGINESTLDNIEEIDNEALNECITDYLTEVYSNVKDFKVSGCKLVNEQLVIEGKITFDSNACKKTTFKFSPYGKNLLKGQNTGLAENAKFFLSYDLKNNRRLITESLKYSYTVNTSLVEGLSKSKHTEY
jgi:hypothetical protein